MAMRSPGGEKHVKEGLLPKAESLTFSPLSDFWV